MSPQVGRNRATERQGVNATQQFFELHNCIYQEVAQQNDFGKDAYIDLAQGLDISPLCIAVQIKSGDSYRTSGGDYYIPLDHHASTWRNSTIPVFGIVYDQDDMQLRWIDLTGYLRNHPTKESGRVPISKNAVLTTTSLAHEFKLAASSYAASNGSAIALRLLSEDVGLQSEAVMDAWALGRGDARYLILVRRLILHLDVEPTRRAIWTLSHATPHPDIFWGPHNWLPDVVRWQTQSSFRWSAEEIEHLFLALGRDELGRGTLGQSLHMLLGQDFYFGQNFHQAIRGLLAKSAMDHAIPIVLIALSISEDPQQTLHTFFVQHPLLLEDDHLQHLKQVLAESNEFYLY